MIFWASLGYEFHSVPSLVRLLTMCPGRDGGRRYLCRTGPPLCENVPRVEESDRKERLGCVERIDRESNRELGKVCRSGSAPPLEIVTSIIRASCCIKSNLFERASGAECLPEHHPSSTEMTPSLCKAELQKILDAFDVCDYCLEFLQVLNPIRGARGQAVSSWLVKMNSTRGCLFP